MFDRTISGGTPGPPFVWPWCVCPQHPWATAAGSSQKAPRVAGTGPSDSHRVGSRTPPRRAKQGPLGGPYAEALWDAKRNSASSRMNSRLLWVWGTVLVASGGLLMNLPDRRDQSNTYHQASSVHPSYGLTILNIHSDSSLRQLNKSCPSLQP